MMKRILFINTLPIVNFSDGKGGSAGNQTLYNTLKGYSEAGYIVKVITFRDIQKKDNPFKNVEICRSKYYWIFKLILKFKKIFRGKKRSVTTSLSPIKLYYDKHLFKVWSIFGYFECKRVIKKFKPDILYGYEVYSTRLAKKLATKFDLPLVTRFQGTELGFFLNENNFFDYYDYIESTKVDSNLAIMANDGTDGDKVLEKIGFDMKKSVFWVNGLHDKDAYLRFQKDKNFWRRNFNLPQNSIVICTANRFVPWKRIDRIISLFDKCSKTNENLHLFIIGDGQEKDALIKFAKKLKNDHIHFVGKMDHDKTIEYIGNSDIYITLNHSGNLGNSILEALCLGTMVITYDSASVYQVLSNGQNSFLINENENIAVDELNSLFKNNKQISSIGKNGRDYAKRELLSWGDRMTMETNLVDKLIKK